MRTSIPAVFAASLLLPAAALSAQTSGVSRPEAIEETISATPVTTPAPTAAPARQADSAVVSTAGSKPVLQVRSEQPRYLAESTAPESRLEERRLLDDDGRMPASTAPVNAEDAGIVTTFPSLKHGLSEGTMMRVRLNEQLSSKTTVNGSHWTGQVTNDIVREGRVIIPTGTTMEGRVTDLHGGRRLGGGASMHLEPERITLPDGTVYHLNARVIDLEDRRSNRVNDEGTIIRSGHAKATLAALSLTTGSAAAAGAVLGGGVGAIVGAGVGAGIGVVWWVRRDRAETLPEGTEMVFSLDRAMRLTPADAE